MQIQMDISDYLIICFFPLSPDEGFLLSIVNVEAETPASKSGLSTGDAIVSVNGWAITCMDKVEV